MVDTIQRAKSQLYSAQASIAEQEKRLAESEQQITDFDPHVYQTKAALYRATPTSQVAVRETERKRRAAK